MCSIIDGRVCLCMTRLVVPLSYADPVLMNVMSFAAAAVIVVLLPGPDTLVVVRGMVRGGTKGGVLTSEYSSADITLDRAGLRALLAPYLTAPLPAELNA